MYLLIEVINHGFACVVNGHHTFLFLAIICPVESRVLVGTSCARMTLADQRNDPCPRIFLVLFSWFGPQIQLLFPLDSSL